MNSLDKRKIQYFTLSFAAAFLALACLALSAAFLVTPYSPEEPALPENKIPYLPKEEDAMNLLLIGIRQENSIPQTCMLVRFSPDTGHLPVLTLPGKTAVRHEDKTLLLGELYQKEGARKTADILGEDLGISIERYVVVSLDNLEKLVELAGNVEYNVPYSIPYTKGEMGLELAKGRQLMDGGQIRELVSCRTLPGGEQARCAMLSDLAAAAVNQHLDLVCSQRADALFRAAVNLVETDADYMDYESHRRALVFMAELKDKPASAFPLTGKFNQAGNTFSIDQACRELIQSVYGAPADKA